VTFGGSASDLEDGDLSSSISWASDLDGALATGASITVSTLSSGAHTITASVTDAGGKTASDSITVTVNAPPTVSIASPQGDGMTVQSGDTVTFAGIATDFEDGDLSSGIEWSSSVDGVLGTGDSIDVTTLSSGAHTITASVTDAGGKTASDSTTITVNTPPVVVITAPEDNSSFSVGESVNFAATAIDPEDGALSSVQWASSMDGPLGSGLSISATLSEGVHTVTATGFDTGGGSDSASITVTITEPPPAPPEASFAASPVTGTAPLTVTFASTSSSPTGPITSSVWDFGDGGSASGPSATHTYVSAGTYTVTLTVTASGGTSTATRQITVTNPLPPPSTQPPPTLPPGNECGGRRCEPRDPGDPPGEELPGRL
jgi:hypothetical protein